MNTVAFGSISLNMAPFSLVMDSSLKDSERKFVEKK